MGFLGNRWHLGDKKKVEWSDEDLQEERTEQVESESDF